MYSPFLVHKPWGGFEISSMLNIPPERYGEAWIYSTLQEGETHILGTPLSQKLGYRVPYLVKIINAAENLSVQVHPNDKWAYEFENGTGKTECWLILDAQPGSGIYVGLKKDISSEAFTEAATAGLDLDKYLNFIPVHANDFIFIPAGTIHAIGAGVTLLEVQQASGITYRLWDWNRKDRELHIEKALKVSDFANREIKILNYREIKNTIFFNDIHLAFNSEVQTNQKIYVDLKKLKVQDSQPSNDFACIGSNLKHWN